MRALSPPLSDTSVVVLVPRLTLLLLLLTANDDPWRLALALAVLIAAVPRPSVYMDGRFWLALGCVMAAWNWAQWYAVDNHIFLVNYWYLALGLSLLASDTARTLATNAALLIGIAFLFAVTWKLISPDFLSGDFFEFTLLTDERFETVARLGGVGAAELAANRNLLGAGTVGSLTTGDGIRAMSAALTWAALVVESMVALTFLVPAWRRARHVALVAFAVPTYLIVPVAGFGATLFVMASATATSDAVRRRWAGAFFVMVVWSAAWVVLFG